MMLQIGDQADVAVAAHARFNLEMLNGPVHQLHSEAEKQGDHANIGYLPSFSKYMDVYDPTNFDEFLLPQYLYKKLFDQRENIARSDFGNCAEHFIIGDAELVALARELIAKPESIAEDHTIMDRLYTTKQPAKERSQVRPDVLAAK